MKIAVIDDEQGIRNVIRDLLEDKGYEVIEADNGRTGLDLIHTSSPDLIICDINMPEMTGDELFETLRHPDSNFEMVPFIFLSGEANQQEQIKRLSNGADNCFQKPFDLNLLAAHVASQLKKVTRISNFIKDNLDKIAASLPKKIEHTFSNYQSMVSNTHGYVNVIISAIHDYQGLDANKAADGGLRGIPAYSPAKDIVINELGYIQYCLDRFKVRRELVKAANGEDLSWTLIFLVAEAQFEKRPIYVSDLYVSIPSAKSTITARINSLIEDDVFTKIGDSNDGRRQQIRLSERFNLELTAHIQTSINMVTQNIP